MPLLSYRLANARGRLTPAERELLQAWVNEPVVASPIKDAAFRGGRAAVQR